MPRANLAGVLLSSTSGQPKSYVFNLDLLVIEEIAIDCGMSIDIPCCVC